jgi:hypothetical protein
MTFNILAGVKNKTGQLRILRERRIMKKFPAIKFKQKWIMPIFSPTHLASD